MGHLYHSYVSHNQMVDVNDRYLPTRYRAGSRPWLGTHRLCIILTPRLGSAFFGGYGSGPSLWIPKRRRKLEAKNRVHCRVHGLKSGKPSESGNTWKKKTIGISICFKIVGIRGGTLGSVGSWNPKICGGLHGFCLSAILWQFVT